MFTHRFREHLTESPAAWDSPFVALPVGLAFAPAAQVLEVYRLAAEQTRRQLAVPPRRALPQFSVN